jgi:hypothetical protein
MALRQLVNASTEAAMWAPPGSISIEIVNYDNRRFPFHVAYASTILHVKQLIYDKQGIPPRQQRLFFEGKEPRDDEPVIHFRRGACIVFNLGAVQYLFYCGFRQSFTTLSSL